MRDLARRLLEASRSTAAASGSKEEESAHAAVVVCERLREALGRFAGPDGFATLLRRALTLARRDVPALEKVQLGPSGELEGLENAVSGKAEPEAGVALAARLLDLLVAFIGEPLTLRLVRDGWPELETGPHGTSDN